jgi:acyl-CoA synthetase (AMP-forming)/AMP-acid ligase II
VRALLNDAPAAATALCAPECAELSYGALRELLDATGQTLHSIGISPGDRVAIVLPNGPEMATAFLAVACAATAAPLNPAYRGDEFEFFLSDLGAAALIVAAGLQTPALEVAHRLGIPVLPLHGQPALGAGRFTLDCSAIPTAAAASTRSIAPEDIALVLHTSGTTSRPKIVPLSQRNLCATARNIRRCLALGPADRGLNIMPLFHIHGLIAGILAPLSAGGSVYCTPGFNALKFFGWMDAAHPTWYTAVPTMHQAILTRVRQNAAVIAANPLRFLRSSSSAMPVAVIRELEEAFGAPVIESYGMTEAAHQMASNPLPPGIRKPGTVGLAAGPAVAILADTGKVVTSGTGEIVIRGDNVTTGYENNPKANSEAFVEGWFRTGDLGALDADGYLSITGRLKEIINRGGEKISPREIDEVLMEHPAVLQVVTFGIPHPKLGEEIGAVIVLREGMQATEQEICDFVAQRVADFKVPRRLLFRDELPKGATGKLQRIGLAQKLGLG